VLTPRLAAGLTSEIKIAQFLTGKIPRSWLRGIFNFSFNAVPFNLSANPEQHFRGSSLLFREAHQTPSNHSSII
jgi:hypothetical protein